MLDGAPPPRQSSSATRRVISVEILNPVELAGTRGRLAGIAGSIAPGLVRRIVYDQTIKTMRRQLAEQGVVADLRLHTVRPPERVGPERAPVARPPTARRAPTEAAQTQASPAGSPAAGPPPVGTPPVGSPPAGSPPVGSPPEPPEPPEPPVGRPVGPAG